MKHIQTISGLLLIAGAGVLAFQIGSRLSDEAVMVIVGVMCGIVASIPLSIGLLVLLTRERISPVDVTPPMPAHSMPQNETPTHWIVIDPNEPTARAPRALSSGDSKQIDA